MAESKQTMARIEKLERESKDFKRALVQITEILIDQSERIDNVRSELGGRIDDLRDSLEGRIDTLRDALEGRLDRLIAVTIQERTYSVERLADIERRLTKLEEHAGF
jgi:hypothetical protein